MLLVCVKLWDTEAGLAQLRELERINGWDLLEAIGKELEGAIVESVLKAKLTFHRVGSIFCLFFSTGPIFDLDTAQRSDTARYAKFFHTCLKRGVYFPPSQFETAFLSVRHQTEDVDATARIVTEALAKTTR